MNGGYCVRQFDRAPTFRKGELMFRRPFQLLLIVTTILTGLSARAQMPFPSDLVPTRTSLERLALERQWLAVVPLVETERLMKITLGGDLMFAQTNYAMVHAFDAESGRHLWSTQLGERTGFARGVAANSFAVYVTNANILLALDKKTGRRIWQHNLGTIPTSSPACDENRLMVGMTSGKLTTLNLRATDAKGNTTILSAPSEAWTWHTGGPITTRPLPAGLFAPFGSSDGRVDTVEASDGNRLFRLTTGGPIGEGLGAFGTRLLLVPSADNNLYGVDLLAAKVLWTFASGAPIEQEPMVADQDIFTINTAGNISQIDSETGEPRWTQPTQGGRLASVSENKLYLRSYNLDLFIMERKTGRTLVDPGESHIRAGLNLRDYDLDIVNRFNDRIYFATSSGMIICLRETGNARPRLLRDPNAHPFGYVPPEGLKPTTPPIPPAAEPGAEPKNEPGMPGADNATPAASEEKVPAEAPKE
jgi:outer membrane protein assembly factor BamB